jgi:folate-binding protein YgfZ
MDLKELRRLQSEADGVFSSGTPTPRAFGAVDREYRAVRTDVGLLDRTGLGRFLVRGPDRFTWLQGLVSNDVRPLAAKADRVQACILDATGHIQADVTLVRLADAILVETERPSLDHLAALLDGYLIGEDATIEDATDSIVCLSLQGPRAADLRSAAPEFLACVAADHTGDGGFDLYWPADRVADAWSALRRAGATPVGEDAAEILRVEAGIPRYGLDLNATVLPLEAGLAATHLSVAKGCYVGQEIVARIRAQGKTNRQLSGLRLDERSGAPGDWVLHDGRVVGRLTSVVDAIGVPGQIALGYLRHEVRAPGSRVTIAAANGRVEATVAALPFVSRKSGAQPPTGRTPKGKRAR